MLQDQCASNADDVNYKLNNVTYKLSVFISKCIVTLESC